MSRRSRIAGFGSAALLFLAGLVCGVVLPGIASDLALGVMGLGIVLAVSLVFLEVGYSEDRARAREEATRQQRDEHQRGLRTPPQPSRRRLGRTRGRPRRLR